RRTLPLVRPVASCHRPLPASRPCRPGPARAGGKRRHSVLRHVRVRTDDLSVTTFPDPTTSSVSEPPTSTGETPFEELPPRRTIRQAVAASAMGNATEWYDYGAYAVVATYIAAHFFPSGSEGLFWTYAFRALSFLARPFGGCCWGPLGARLGRKQVAADVGMLVRARPCLRPSRSSP